jgi:hypothetical protein
LLFPAINDHLIMKLRFPQALLALLLTTAVTAHASLVAYWPFSAAGTLGTDTVGGTVLTANGGAGFTATGKFGGGLALTGVSQFLGGTVPGLPSGNGSYTQSAWIKPAVLGQQGIMGWGNYGATRQVIAIRMANAGIGNGFSHYWWGADLDVVVNPTVLNSGAWHHIATTYDGTNRRIYLNG